MKDKLLLILGVILVFTGPVVFVAMTSDRTHKTTIDTKRSAEVNLVEGICIFTDCNPVSSYDNLGDVKVGSSGGLGNDSYNSQRDAAIKKVKKDYPTADGILISFKGNGACMATAIKFK
jgi:hypothetical protein